MAPARKVYTEAMIRRVLRAHFEVEPEVDTKIDDRTWCECGWMGSNFEDHFIDQLHKLWHEMFGRKPSTTTPTDPNTIVESEVR